MVLMSILFGSTLAYDAFWKADFESVQFCWKHADLQHVSPCEAHRVVSGQRACYYYICRESKCLDVPHATVGSGRCHSLG